MRTGPEASEAKHPVPTHASRGAWGDMLAVKNCANAFAVLIKKFSCIQIIFIGYHVYTGSSGHRPGHPDPVLSEALTG